MEKEQNTVELTRSMYMAEITLLLVIAVIGLRKKSWLWLNNDFGALADQKMEFSVNNMDEVINIFERIIIFCEEKGISSHNNRRIILFDRFTHCTNRSNRL